MLNTMLVKLHLMMQIMFKYYPCHDHILVTLIVMVQMPPTLKHIFEHNEISRRGDLQ